MKTRCVIGLGAGRVSVEAERQGLSLLHALGRGRAAWLGWLLVALVACSADASSVDSGARVYVERGNVFLAEPNREPVQVTDTGLDREAILSPDGRTVAFLREIPGRPCGGGAELANVDEVWTAEVSTARARKVLEGRCIDFHKSDKENDMERLLYGLYELQFSRDGKQLFFLSMAWAVTSALHRLDLETGEEKFLTGANGMRVLTRGENADRLLLYQVSLFDDSGARVTTETYSLADLDGNRLRKISESEFETLERAGTTLVP